MNNEFGRILSFLRKEKGLSQKKVATDLEISQGLLSHYEKGIRECGLDFLSKVADYFNVSTDYLLGRTVNPMGLYSEIKEIDLEESQVNISNTYCLISKKVNGDTNALIYSLLSDLNSKKLNKHISEYLNSAQYVAFRKLFNICCNDDDEMFSIPLDIAEVFSQASMNVNLAKISKLTSEYKDKNKNQLSSKIIAQKHPNCYSSLYNLIRNTEKNLHTNFKI